MEGGRGAAGCAVRKLTVVGVVWWSPHLSRVSVA